MRWYADNIWLFVPVGAKIKDFLATLPRPTPIGRRPGRILFPTPPQIMKEKPTIITAATLALVALLAAGAIARAGTPTIDAKEIATP